MNLRFAITLLVSNILIISAGLAQQSPVATQPDTQLQKLSSDFWAWRSSEQPFSTDDIPRLDRPEGWAANWSASMVAKRRKELETAGGYAYPASQTPWQEIQRAHIGQMGTGMVLENAVKYQKIDQTKGIPRDNH